VLYNSQGVEMSNVKQGLKAAKAALDSQNFSEAASQARNVLEADPKNYFAYVAGSIHQVGHQF